MTEKIFRIDFYPQEWLVKTGNLTPEQCGLYIQIIALIYANRGPVPLDTARFGRLLNCSARKAKVLFEELVSLGKLKIHEGFVTNSRAESELKVKRTIIESGSKGGRKTAENQPVSSNNKEIVSSEIQNSLPSSSPSLAYPSLNKLAKRDLKKEKEEYHREEVLPAHWQDLAEAKNIPNEQIFISWRKFKERTSHPFQLTKWKAWIDRENVYSKTKTQSGGQELAH